MKTYHEPAKDIPVREYDVVVAGGGTAGVCAALAAAYTGAKTALIEIKGYVGGIAVEGGTALHSFYNLFAGFPGVEKRQVVKGIPQKIIDELMLRGGCSGHAMPTMKANYDSVCTAIDTEIFKLTAFDMLVKAGVHVYVNTMVAGAAKNGAHIEYLIAESRSGREAFAAKSFIDATGYGDLSAHAGAAFTEPNDHPVANSIGVANVSIEKYYEFLKQHDALGDYCEGERDGVDGKIVRVDAIGRKLPEEYLKATNEIGMSSVITSVHDNYFMFIKFNYKMPESPVSRDASVPAELELRKRQQKGIEILRKYVPGCEHAFIARTSPSLCIRRGRCITCDYDITNEDVIHARHFPDDIMSYGFHDCAPRFQVKDGGTYGIPYRALLVKGIENLYAVGMMITSGWEAHMSTRNTVGCMGQGQAAGTAAALCALKTVTSRQLSYADLKKALLAADVYLEN